MNKKKFNITIGTGCTTFLMVLVITTGIVLVKIFG